MLRDATMAELNAEFGQELHAAVSRAALTCIADIQSEPLRWLWPGRLPLGKLSILSGDPGLGKSLVTLAIAAAVSRGAPWPCSEGNAPLGNVVLISAEDDAGDTIRPRLEAAGANLKRIHILEGVDQPNENGEIVRRLWNFGDLAALDRLLEDMPECRLVIVDPISAFLAGTDSHKNADVRALLAPLADLAAKHGVVLLAVSHLNKSAGPAMYRTTGSLAFVAAARAAYAVAKDIDDPSRRLVLPIKCNLSPDSCGLAYRIGHGENDTPVVEWEPEPVTITADEALAYSPNDDDRGGRQEVVDWLRRLLSNGPLPTRMVQQECDTAGFTWRTVQRAMHEAGAESRRIGFGQQATWALTSRAMRTHTQRLGANGTVGATVANTGLASASQDTDPSVAPTPNAGASIAKSNL